MARTRMVSIERFWTSASVTAALSCSCLRPQRYSRRSRLRIALSNRLRHHRVVQLALCGARLAQRREALGPRLHDTAERSRLRLAAEALEGDDGRAPS